MNHERLPMTRFSYRNKEFSLHGAFEEDHIFRKIVQRNGFYELDFLEFFRFVVGREGAIIDAGANIGNHSIFFSKVMLRRVFAFEPSVATFKVLELNCGANSTNVETFNQGLSYKGGFADFLSDGVVEKNVGMAKLGETSDRRGPIELTSIDEFLETQRNIESLAAIKIDVEGYEENVLNGALRSISKYKPSIFVECQDGASFQAVSEILTKLNYSPVSVMGATPMWHFAPNERRIEAIRSRSWLAYRNLRRRFSLKRGAR